MNKHALAVLLSVCAAAIGLSACGSSSGSGGSGKDLTLVAYSTPQAAFEKLIPAFQATPDGKGVTFKQSYGPSGEQSRSVANGLHADVVDFSLEPDVERLVKAGPGRRELEPERHARLRDQLGRRDHRAQGQPQAHHRTGPTWSSRACRWSRRTRSPRAARAGTSWPPTARSSRKARPPRRREAYLKATVQERGQPGQLGAQRAADVRRRPRRRADRLRERGDHRPEEGRTRSNT